MSLGIRKLFKKKYDTTSVKNVVCKNCETKFDGKFCPNCGQSVRDYDQPFSFIFFNFVGDFFSFDTRFIRTFAALLIQPGFLTKEYFYGKIVKYAPPLRIFIFVSFILFLLLQIYTNKGLTTVIDSDFSSDNSFGIDSSLNETYVRLDSVSALDNTLLINKDDTLKVNDFSLNMENFRDTRNLRHALIKLANVLEEELKTEIDPKKQVKLREHIWLCRSPEQATAKILEYMSWAFFLLLPMFALILKMVYIRHKQNYMRHLIFSIHIQSFIFVILTIVVGLHLIFRVNLEIASAALIFYIPIYFIIALKKFYGQNIGKVFLKFIVVSVFYNFIFWVVVIFVFLNVLSII